MPKLWQVDLRGGAGRGSPRNGPRAARATPCRDLDTVTPALFSALAPTGTSWDPVVPEGKSPAGPETAPCRIGVESVDPKGGMGQFDVARERERASLGEAETRWEREYS
jgi:hypothetical protein